MKPAPGQYWRSLREPAYRDGIPKGTLVLVTEIDEEGIHFVYGECGFSWEEGEDDKFEDAYEFVPDGREQKAKQLTDLLVEFQTMTPEVPKVLPLAQAGFSVDDGAMVLSGSLKPAQVRQAVATARNTALKFKRDMLRKQEELKALLSEQEHALQAKVDSLNKMVEIASEAIWTIELYLGRHEEIKQLRGGKAAPEEEKIVVRQLVLNMDEECAVAAEHGGIDSHEVHEFDAWVKKPKNLQQVLPETKGIVAFHVRGEQKRDGDPDAVYETYFLIRNGERLYRIHTSLTVGLVLFPRHDEFENFFYNFTYDWDTHERLKKPLHPGSHGYMEAMKTVDKRRRHYFRILLFMQGLIDRTKVFKPLPCPVVNLCDPKHHEEFLRFVRDAEMVLSDGRPRFSVWRDDINSRMEVGMRVIGEFRSYHAHGRDMEYRSHPRGLRPDSHALYTVERKEDSYFVILFPYERWSGHSSGKRASFQLHPGDDFVINFDLVTLADIDYYMSNRIDRSAYTNMFPLLKCVRRLKVKEEQEEASFRKLLAGEIVKAHGVTVEQAAARVDDLVRWWKYKNKTHRALKSDDAKAIRMIVQEFRLEHERARDLKEQAALVDPVVKALRKAAKDAIYVGHQRGTQYVTIAPMNEDDIFVCEQVWRLSKRNGSLEEIACREWALLDKRVERWQELWSTQRWPKIKIGVRRENVITDPEIEQAIEWGFKEARERAEEESEGNRFWGHRGELRGLKHLRFYRLAVTWHPDKYGLLLYYSTHQAVIPTGECILTARRQTAPIRYMEIVWDRKGDALSFHRSSDHEIDCTATEPPWVYRKSGHHYHHQAAERTRLLRSWPENLEVLTKEEAAYEATGEERARLKSIVARARHAVECRMLADNIEAEHAKFREDLQDESLWEDHLKERQQRSGFRHPNMHELADPLAAIVEQGLKLGGKSLAWAIKTAERLKHPLKTEYKLPTAFKFPKDVDVDPPKEKGKFAKVPDELDDEDWED